MLRMSRASLVRAGRNVLWERGATRRVMNASHSAERRKFYATAYSVVTRFLLFARIPSLFCTSCGSVCEVTLLAQSAEWAQWQRCDPCRNGPPLPLKEGRYCRMCKTHVTNLQTKNWRACEACESRWSTIADEITAEARLRVSNMAFYYSHAGHAFRDAESRNDKERIRRLEQA